LQNEIPIYALPSVFLVLDALPVSGAPKHRLLLKAIMQKRSICQDRLGTNIGKAQHKKGVLCRRGCGKAQPEGAPPLHAARAEEAACV